MLEHALIAMAEKRPSEYLPFYKWDWARGGKKEERYPLKVFISTLIKQCATCGWVTEERVQLLILPMFATDGVFLGFHMLDKRWPSGYNHCHIVPWYIFMTVTNKHAPLWDRSRQHWQSSHFLSPQHYEQIFTHVWYYPIFYYNQHQWI